MITDVRSQAGTGPTEGPDGSVADLEQVYRELHDGIDGVPTPKQFLKLEELAARLEVTVHPAKHEGTCTDRQTGRAVDPELAAELLWQADRQAWQLDAAEVHQAEVVAGITAHAGWRSLSTVQRRALSSWRQRYPGLTYGTLLEEAPDQARRRLELHGWLASGAKLDSLPEEPEPAAADIEEDEPEVEAVEEKKTELVVVPPPQPDADDGAEDSNAGKAVAADAGPAPNAMYTEAETIDAESLAAATAQGNPPPDDAKGFVRIDPYGLTNRLNDAVMGYFDKLELTVPRGAMVRLSKRVAEYNGLDAAPSDEMTVGHYIWFPARETLKVWIHEQSSKK